MNKFIQLSTYFLLRNIFHFFFHLKSSGIGNIKDLKKPVLIVSNHPSRIDSFFLYSLPYFPGRELLPFAFMTAEKYYKKLWLKILIKPLGAYPIPKSAWTMKEYFESTVDKLNKNYTIMLFPEGKLNKIGNKLPAKKGIGYLIKNNDMTILPIRIFGAEGLTIKSGFFRHHHIKVIFGKPFSSTQIKDMSIEDISEYVLDKVYELL